MSHDFIAWLVACAVAGVAFMFAISNNYNPTPISMVAATVTYVSVNVALAANKKPKE